MTDDKNTIDSENELTVDPIDIKVLKKTGGFDFESPLIRTECIHLENDTIGDGYFVLEVAKTLRQYADMLESGKAGHREVDTFVSPGGTRLFAIGAAWSRRNIP